jgi:hypothetical protein
VKISDESITDYSKDNTNYDRSVAQVVGGLLPTVAAQVRTLFRSFRICGGRSSISESYF